MEWNKEQNPSFRTTLGHSATSTRVIFFVLYESGGVIGHSRSSILKNESTLCSEMGIYRDNLSAIVIGDNLLPNIVIAQNSLDLSITDIAFVKYLVISDKQFFMLAVFKLQS